MKMKMLEVRFELNLNEALGDTADLGNVDTTTGWEIIDMNLMELSQGKLINIMRKIIVTKGWRCPRLSDAYRKFHIWGTLNVSKNQC